MRLVVDRMPRRMIVTLMHMSYMKAVSPVAYRPVSAFTYQVKLDAPERRDMI